MITPASILRLLQLLVWILFLVPGTGLSQQAALTLSDKPHYFLAGHMEVLRDPSLRMGFSEALSRHREGAFRALEGNLNAGYARSAYWLHFTLVRSEAFPRKAMLSISPSYTNEVGAYVLTAGKSASRPSSYRRIDLGSDVPVVRRPVLNPDFVIPLDLRENQPLDVFVRVYSKGSISLTGKVSSVDDLRNSTYGNIMLQFGYLGIALVLCVMNLIFFISIRDRLYLYFALYSLIVLGNNLGVSGMIALILPASAHILYDYMVYMGIGAQMLVFSEFSYALFRGSAGSWSLRYMRLMSLTGLFTMVAVPLGFYYLIVPSALIGIIFLIVMLLIISKNILESMPQSGIFITIAFGISTLGYFYQILRLIGIFPLESSLNINMVEPATLVHMVLISIALSERFRITERQLGEASREAEKRAMELAADMTSELRENKERLEVALAAEHLSLERQHQFLTMLSHEYRTPLAIIQGNLDILAINSEDGSVEESPELMKMRRAVSRLVDLMDVSLEQSRLNDPQIAEQFSRFGADEFIRQQIDAVRWMWPSRTFSLVSTIKDECICGERPLLNTALFNLLDNAQKYSPGHTPVEVTCSGLNSSLVIAVANQSQGLDVREAESLFEKYRRGRNSHNTSGAGIGLWLVRQIIEQHQGTIRIAAEANGRVTVTLTLPSCCTSG